ncbi:hypothetical protein [Flavobacterium sp. SM2513]|uniref:hypothetical protein n=1 Tax=Flavobacterium sp. SM2513 TaxID=3424766 RepID=UPI003D7F1F7E
MKKIKQLGKIAFLALALSFGSCSSDDGGGSTGGTAASGTIKATVAGKTITTMAQGTFATHSGSFLTITGSTMSQEALGITIYDFTGEGTYELITGNNLGVVFSYTKIDLNNPMSTSNSWYAPLDETTGTSGTVTITEATETNVKGTFSFKGINDLGTYKEVKNGAFNVAFTQ